MHSDEQKRDRVATETSKPCQRARLSCRLHHVRMQCDGVRRTIKSCSCRRDQSTAAAAAAGASVPGGRTYVDVGSGASSVRWARSHHYLALVDDGQVVRIQPVHGRRRTCWRWRWRRWLIPVWRHRWPLATGKFVNWPIDRAGVEIWVQLKGMHSEQ